MKKIFRHQRPCAITCFVQSAALLLVLSNVSAAPAREWILTFAATDTNETVAPSGQNPSPLESRSFTQSVALGTNYLVVTDDGEKTVYDFSGRRCIHLNLADSTYDNLPLAYLVDLLDYELTNRYGLGAAMQAAHVTQVGDLFDRFQNESELHLVNRRGPPDTSGRKMTPAPWQDGLEFRYEGKSIVTFLPAKDPLPAEFQHRFVNYLAYACSIHPEIRAAIAANGNIPRELVFTWHHANIRTTRTLRLLSSQAAATDSTMLPAGVKPAAHASDPFYQVIAAVHDLVAADRRPTREAAAAFARTALAGHRPLDALLALIEYTQQSGEQVTDELQRHVVVFQSDDSCQRYIKSLNQSSKTACEQSLATLATIDRTGLHKAYVLDLQRANLLDRLGRFGETRDLYFTVLRTNPANAGALHDLGLAFAQNFDQPKAWLCWEAARSLYPNHPMLLPIARHERELAAAFPDFF